MAGGDGLLIDADGDIDVDGDGGVDVVDGEGGVDGGGSVSKFVVGTLLPSQSK